MLHLAHPANLGLSGSDWRAQKPANVLVVATPTRLHCKVGDFGLLKWTDKDGRRPLGRRAGTPGYRCPAMLADARCTTAAADVYSLGALLWALSMLRTPREGESLQACP